MRGKELLDKMANIDPAYIEAAERSGGKKRRSLKKWAAMAACLCLMAACAMVMIPKTSHDQGSGKKPMPGGSDDGIMYSLAVFPVEEELSEVKNAYCENIYLEEAESEVGLCDYLPTVLPKDYHFAFASIYVTTMKDDTVYKMLNVTYRKGEGETEEELPDEEGGVAVMSPDDFGDEFRLSIYPFKPDTSVRIYTMEEALEALTDGNVAEGFFYVQYGDYFVGIEPLSLSAEEIMDLINCIG